MKRDIAGPGESRFFEGLFKQELASTKSSAMTRAEPLRNSRGKSMIAFLMNFTRFADRRFGPDKNARGTGAGREPARRAAGPRYLTR